MARHGSARRQPITGVGRGLQSVAKATADRPSMPHSTPSSGARQRGRGYRNGVGMGGAQGGEAEFLSALHEVAAGLTAVRDRLGEARIPDAALGKLFEAHAV